MANAGRYRERAAFQRLSESAVDAYGNVYTGWKALASRWVDLREMTGKEAIQGGALADVSQATLRVRKESITETVTTADRVTVRGATWAIKNVIQLDAKGVELEFRIERGVAA